MPLRLLIYRQLKSGGYGLVRGAHPYTISVVAGNSWPGIQGLGWEAMVKAYGVTVAMPQG